MRLEGLPPDSAYHRSGKLWTLENELLAKLIDRQEVWLSQLVAAWAAKGSKLEPPIQITHPDRASKPAEERRKATSDPQELMRAFGGR